MPVLDPTAAKRIIDRVLTRARGSDAQVAVTSAAAGNTRFAVNEITSSAEVERLSLAVTIAFGQRSATATTNQIDDRSLDDVVARARWMAKLAPDNPETMPPLTRQSYLAVPGASDPPTAGQSPAARAQAVAAALGRGGPALQLAGYYERTARALALGSSAGLTAYHALTQAHMTCTARTADGTGSGWAGGSSHRAGDLDAAKLSALAVDKATRSAKPTKLDPGRYTVVLEPAAVADLLGFLIGAFGARRADEGRSYFTKPGGGTKVGDKLFPDTITLRSDPRDVALGGGPFDRDGIPLQPTPWIERGVVKGLVYGRYWAHKQNKPVTGQPSSWILDGGSHTADSLLKGIARGVLITRLWYLRSLDPQTILVTGLTRDGTFLIENGAITRPLVNFRFNDSPVEMLARCDGLAAPVIAGGMRVPALRTHDFNLASISEAV